MIIHVEMESFYAIQSISICVHMNYVTIMYLIPFLVLVYILVPCAEDIF